MPLLVPTTTATISGGYSVLFMSSFCFFFGLKTPVRVVSEVSVKRATLRFCCCFAKKN